MVRTPRTPGVAALALLSFACAGLSACNDTQAARTKIEADWIHDSGPADPSAPTTSPEPATPSPVPTLSPTPPTPVPSPSPSPSVPVSELYIGDPAFAPYVEKFVSDAALQGVDLIPEMRADPVVIELGSLDSLGSGVIGLCESGYNGRTVTLDPDFWGRISETQDELLMHHELGHCILYRPHRSALLSSGREASIMNPIIMASSTYLGNYDYYQNELYTYSAAQSEARTAGSGEGGGTTSYICDMEEVK